MRVREGVDAGRIIVRPVIIPFHRIPTLQGGDEPPRPPPTTFVTVGDDNIIDIGGMKITRAEAESAVPLLGDLPMVSRLFKNSDRVRHAETIIFVRPRLLLIKE